MECSSGWQFHLWRFIEVEVIASPNQATQGIFLEVRMIIDKLWGIAWVEIYLTGLSYEQTSVISGPRSDIKFKDWPIPIPILIYTHTGIQNRTRFEFNLPVFFSRNWNLGSANELSPGTCQLRIPKGLYSTGYNSGVRKSLVERNDRLTKSQSI